MNNEIMIPSIKSNYTNAMLKVENFEAVKNAISLYAKKYETVEIVDENEITSAKKDLADLRKKRTLIDNERKSIKKEILLQFEEGEKQFKELAETLDNAINNIDKQLKEFDAKAKENKYKEIEQTFNSIDKNEHIKIEKIMDERWLNKSYSINLIKEEIIEKVSRIESELSVLWQVVTDAKEQALITNDYVKNYDLNYAMTQHKERLKAIDTLNVVKQLDKKIEQADNRKYKLAFAFEGTRSQIEALQEFFKQNNMTYKQIKDKELIEKVLKGETI